MIISKRRPPVLLPTQPYDPGVLDDLPSSSTFFCQTPSLPLQPIAKWSTGNAIASSSTGSPRPPSRTERKFACSHEGCDKAYFKPSRLAEHELSHTGIRPHSCPHCSQTYLRASHLTAHLRTHLSADDKLFVCTRQGCSKRFWTSTHLTRHETSHDQAITYTCTHCEESFPKAHQLRDHVTLAHMPAGTKPYPCNHQGCEWTFALKHQLKTHEKIHDPDRYTCSHPSHGDELPRFSVWSALQNHLHRDHPPQCPHLECEGRTFKSTQRLKDHLKVHAERIQDLESQNITEEDEIPSVISDGLLSRREKKRRRSDAGTPLQHRIGKLRRVESGEAGKDWNCQIEGCEKRFKSKYAMETHVKTFHLHIKVHTCSICLKSYGHATNLRRHMTTHSVSTIENGDTVSSSLANGGGDANIDIGEITGEAYQPGGNEYRRYGCPFHLYSSKLTYTDAHDPAFRPSTNDILAERLEREIDEINREADSESGMGKMRCLLRFWRVYDVRRHLKGAHHVDLGDMEVRRLLHDMGEKE